EQVLRIEPANSVGLAQLVEIYGALSRNGDLLRVLDARVRAATDPLERTQVLLQIGELRERTGDLDSALEYYHQAFDLDPGNRVAFTSLERACYRRERW